MIHFLAAEGDDAAVRAELRKGVPADTRDAEDYTPLARAAASRNADQSLLQLLIEAGADVNAKVENGKTFPLSLAACTGDLKKVHFLLIAGARVELASQQGYTALINACFALIADQALLPMLTLLASHGADLNHATEYGECPLSVASMRGRFDAVKWLLDAGADPTAMGWTPLMVAVASGRYLSVQRLLDETNWLWERDRFDRNAWLLATSAGDLSIAKLLLSAGADVNDCQRGQVTALMNCCYLKNAEMANWIVAHGAIVDAEDMSGDTALMIAAQVGAADCVRVTLAAGADPLHRNEYQECAMTKATTEPIIRMLLDAGVSHSELSKEGRRTLLGLLDTEGWTSSHADYQEACQVRFGRANPELVDYPFWNEMVRTGRSAYQARRQFGYIDGFTKPVWCFDRFGMSLTALPDGRFVQIGGEHEDFYMPDFNIYNDVTVHDGAGRFQIRIYPAEVFPPTDFHSATYVDGFIYIIGRLGYHGTREYSMTPVYRLSCADWKMEEIATSGDNPGWIYKHQAESLGGNAILVSGGKICREIDGKEDHFDNEQTYRLDLTSRIWTRVQGD